MDSIDRQLLEALRKDGRASYAELARYVGLSSSAVHERVGKLEAAGVIQSYRAMVKASALGLGVTALIGIEPSESSPDETVVDGLRSIPEIEACWGVAGTEAFVITVRVPTVDALNQLLGRLRAIDGVARTRTTVVLSTWFEGRPVPGIRG